MKFSLQFSKNEPTHSFFLRSPLIFLIDIKNIMLLHSLLLDVLAIITISF